MERIFFFLFVFIAANIAVTAQTTCPVPLYTDPIFKGAADPEVIWNDYEKEWWIYYTSRRAVCPGAPLPALAIGVAASKDWITWKHKGYIKIDGIGGDSIGPDILWAPGIVKDGDTYHMFLTYKKGNGGGSRWGTPESLILHLTAPSNNLLYGWQTKCLLNVPFNSIDATIIKRGNVWNIFHRDIPKESKWVNTFRITTEDINSPCSKWNYLGAAKGDVNDKTVNGCQYQEAPFVFFWKDNYWLLTDPTSSPFIAYQSLDLESWAMNGRLCEKEGEDVTQKGLTRHPAVVIIGDRAFIFYFCQPFMKENDNPEKQKCFLQISELKLENDKLTFNRSEKVIPPKNLIPQ